MSHNQSRKIFQWHVFTSKLFPQWWRMQWENLSGVPDKSFVRHQFMHLDLLQVFCSLGQRGSLCCMCSSSSFGQQVGILCSPCEDSRHAKRSASLDELISHSCLFDQHKSQGQDQSQGLRIKHLPSSPKMRPSQGVGRREGWSLVANYWICHM